MLLNYYVYLSISFENRKKKSIYSVLYIKLVTSYLPFLPKLGLPLLSSQRKYYCSTRSTFFFPFRVDGYCKTLKACDIKFSRLIKKHILAHFNFGVHNLPSLQIVKIKCKFITCFYFLLNYTLCHLLESPHGF